MTRSRHNPDRLLFGVIGSIPDARKFLSHWNRRFAEQAIDASMQQYPTTERTIPERLSEMFHFDRRGYIVGKALQKAIIPYLDSINSSRTEKGSGRVDTVLNVRGVLQGYFLDGNDEKRKELWLNNS